MSHLVPLGSAERRTVKSVPAPSTAARTTATEDMFDEHGQAQMDRETLDALRLGAPYPADRNPRTECL